MFSKGPDEIRRSPSNGGKKQPQVYTPVSLAYVIGKPGYENSILYIPQLGESSVALEIEGGTLRRVEVDSEMKEILDKAIKTKEGYAGYRRVKALPIGNTPLGASILDFVRDDRVAERSRRTAQGSLTDELSKKVREETLENE